MSRVAKNQPVNKQMYRHFAVITIMLTLVLAVFADGSNRDGLTDRMRTERQRSELESADAQMFGKHKLGGTDSAGRTQSRTDGGGSADDGGVDADMAKSARPSRNRGSGSEDAPEFISYYDLGVAPLPTRAGVIVTGGRNLPPGLGPTPPKSAKITGKKQGQLPGANRAPSQAKREQLVNTGFQDAGSPTQ